jgi:hypothetical protein
LFEAGCTQSPRKLHVEIEYPRDPGSVDDGPVEDYS